MDSLSIGVLAGIVAGIVAGIAGGILGPLVLVLLLPRKKCPDCGQPLTRLRNCWIRPALCGAAPLATAAWMSPAARWCKMAAAELRPLMIAASDYDIPPLLDEWRWLVPAGHTPLFLSAFGDWVFGHPDGSLWLLCVLEGSYEQFARDAAEYNTLNKTVEWVENTFIAGWQPIAAHHGLTPGKDECLGWRLPPILGGKIEVTNLQVFSMRVYQALTGQLHRQLRQHPS